jgi:hypothetical protein
VRLFSIVKLALSAICFLPVSACVQSSGDTIFEGIKKLETCQLEICQANLLIQCGYVGISLMSSLKALR